jgi:hypothetical protein
LLMFHFCSTRTRALNPPPTEPCMGRMHWYNEVLPSALKGLLVTLLLLPRFRLAFCMMLLHSLTLVDRSPLPHPKTVPFNDEDTKCWILDGFFYTVDQQKKWVEAEYKKIEVLFNVNSDKYAI